MSSTEKKKLQIGVLGCGLISQYAHFEACRRANNAELYAICDVAEDLLARMTELHQPKVAYSSYEQMLADPLVDAVVIGISDQFHVPAAMQALLSGKHVLVEKPLGTSIEECESLAKLVEQSGLILQVGNMKRFDPGIANARLFINDEIGELLSLKAWYCDSAYRYTVTNNIQPLSAVSPHSLKPEGAPKADKTRYYMLTHGSHLVDTVRYLGGEITAVRAWHTEKFGAHSWSITTEFASGFVGQLDLTIAVQMDWHEGFQIYGEHGSIIGKTYHPWLFKSSDVEIFSEKDRMYHRPLGEDAHVFKLQIEGFAAAILEGAPMRGATVYDGLAAMRAMVAIARSAESGETVKLANVFGSV